MSRIMASALLAGLLIGTPPLAVCAHAQAAVPFEEVLVGKAPQRSHRAAYIAAALGVGLIGTSFAITDVANGRYDEYLAATDPAVIEDRYQATVRADRLASASLLTGEALVVTALYLRFLRRSHESRVSLTFEPRRCAVTLRF